MTTLSERLRAGETFHTQVSEDWEEYKTVARHRSPPAIQVEAANEIDRLHSVIAAHEQARGQPEGVVIDSYAIPTAILYGDEIKIQRTRQLDHTVLWKVCRLGECLNKLGDWEYEPMPSSRDDDFINRCRFNTAEDAIRAALAGAGESK